MPINLHNSPKPLIAHVLYRFDVGGLENGVVNLINRLPGYDHAVIALTEVTDFKRRITRGDVRYVSLHKPPGHGFKIYLQLYRCFRSLRPAIVHTRNLGALEAQLPARLAGVPVRIHGEHGWDMQDLGAGKKSHALQRRLFAPLVQRFVALSAATRQYLIERVGIRAERIIHLYNGVDTQRFTPTQARLPHPDMPFKSDDLFIIGTVGRLQAVKDQLTLAHAFVRALQCAPELRSRLRLVIAGDGPLRAAITDAITEAQCRDLVWMAGAREDVPDLLRSLDLFVLPSLAEGLSNTVLEAMACGLPVLATDVGGNAELVLAGETGAGQTGELVAAADEEAMAQAILRYARDAALGRMQGRAGRERAESRFSINSMVANYAALYNEGLQSAGLHTPCATLMDAKVNPASVQSDISSSHS